MRLTLIITHLRSRGRGCLMAMDMTTRLQMTMLSSSGQPGLAVPGRHWPQRQHLFSRAMTDVTGGPRSRGWTPSSTCWHTCMMALPLGLALLMTRQRLAGLVVFPPLSQNLSSLARPPPMAGPSPSLPAPPLLLRMLDYP